MFLVSNVFYLPFQLMREITFKKKQNPYRLHPTKASHHTLPYFCLWTTIEVTGTRLDECLDNLIPVIFCIFKFTNLLKQQIQTSFGIDNRKCFSKMSIRIRMEKSLKVLDISRKPITSNLKSYFGLFLFVSQKICSFLYLFLLFNPEYILQFVYLKCGYEIE